MFAQKFIASFHHLKKLTVSCVYEPYAPLKFTSQAQVDSLKIILDKKVTESFLEQLSCSLRNKNLKALTIFSVFKCSAYLAASSLDAILDGNSTQL